MAIGRREKKIIKASWHAIIGNALLAVLKIVVGLASGSLAVVADGIDSASDILTSLITLFTAHIIARPPDMRYPYGYQKADTIATKALSFIIFFAGAQLALSSFDSVVHPVSSVMPERMAIYIILVSIAGKLLLTWYLRRTGKSVQSAMLIANARNMQNDVVISISVLVGLVFTFIFEMPIIDKLTALFVSGYIMFVAFKIFMESNRDLMDGVEGKDVYQSVIDAVKGIEGAQNPHRIRVRKMAHLYLIALDVEVDGNLPLQQAHDIGALVEKRIKEAVMNVYDILVHIEPIGNNEPNEAFGVSEQMLADD